MARSIALITDLCRLPGDGAVFRTQAVRATLETNCTQHQIQCLRRTRDVLLPRLLSGQANLTSN